MSEQCPYCKLQKKDLLEMDRRFNYLIKYPKKPFIMESIDNAAANLADESQKECVVCYTATKDTVVLPCRHMCLCIDCSQIVRMQTNKCPICRTQVSSFLHIKYDLQMPIKTENTDLF